MRAVRLALAACLLLLAVGVTAIDSQASARSVEDRWKNCSQINRGRLGALHDADGSQMQLAFDKLRYPANATDDYVTIQFSPCVPKYDSWTDYIVITSVSTWGTKNLPGRSTIAAFNQVLVAGTNTVATPNGEQRLVTFTMPDTSDAVPMLTANYRSTSITGPTISLAVTAKCDPSITGANVTVFNATGTQWTMTINTVEACARFPYTNQALPAGGVAALIICIVCFLLEFAACFKYHQDNKNHSPLDEESMR